MSGGRRFHADARSIAVGELDGGGFDAKYRHSASFRLREGRASSSVSM